MIDLFPCTGINRNNKWISVDDYILSNGDEVMDNKNNINNRYEAIIPKTIFHYTSFEKFKCILQYGTWRFKLSTQSNDLLDTTYIIDIIKKLEIQKNLTDDHRRLLEMLIGYFKRGE
jgi:hypothetical protein